MVNRCSHMPVPLPTQSSSSSGHTRAIVAWHSDLPQAPCSCKSVCPTPGLCGSLATSSTHKQRRTLGALFQQSQRAPLVTLPGNLFYLQATVLPWSALLRQAPPEVRSGSLQGIKNTSIILLVQKNIFKSHFFWR